MSVELHSDPGRFIVPDRIIFPRITVIVLLSVHPEGLHDHDEDDRHGGPDSDTKHDGNSLMFFVWMFQVLIVTEETP